MILLSARTAGQLRQKAMELLEFVGRRRSEIDLVALAYTLQVGREAMEERLGLKVKSLEELEEKLTAYVRGEEEIEEVYQGQVKGNKEVLSLFHSDGDLKQTVEQWVVKRKYSKLLEMWVKGLEVDWSKLYGESKPERMSLPTYPFARERYWIDIDRKMGVGAQNAGNGVAAPVLHPLLHRNTSDLRQHSYSTTFSGEEFFLKEHPVDSGRMLPPAVYLEMARAAVERARPSAAEEILELRDVVWGEAAMVTRKREVNIALLANDHDQIDFEIYSQAGDEEIIHCQGHAVWSGQTASKLDLEQLRASGETLERLQLLKGAENTLGEYVLHPYLLEEALQTAVGMLDNEQLIMPSELEKLRIFQPCASELYAWVRYSPGSQARDSAVSLDIDLCDEWGSIRAQMRGLSWQETGKRIVREAALPASKELSGVVKARKELVLGTRQQTRSSPVEQKETTRIALGVPGQVAMPEKAPSEKLSSGRAQVTLSTTFVRSALPESRTVVDPSVRLFDCGGGIFSIEIDGESLTQERIAGLLAALERAQGEAAIKVLLLRGIAAGPRRGGRDEYNQAVQQDLYAALVSFPYPVIAVLAGDASGAGFLLATLCDFMVLNKEASYGYTDEQNGVYPTVAETVLFGERFGEVLAQDFLYVSKTATGKQLIERGWTCPIVPAGEVEAVAEELASELAEKSQMALGLLKPHLTRRLVGG